MHAAQNSLNAVQQHQTSAQVAAEEESNQLISILKEEASNLRAKMIQMTEENSKLKKENVRLTQNEGVKYRQQIESKNEEIRTLKSKLFEQSSEQGLQLLNALKDDGSSLTSLQNDSKKASTKASSDNGTVAAKDAMN